jgi:hypothetical protein
MRRAWRAAVAARALARHMLDEPMSNRLAHHETGNKFEERDRIRREVAAPYLRGRGIEIGAGAFPHPLGNAAESVIFDLRDREQLEQYFGHDVGYDVHPIGTVKAHFSAGADFLIAHNVLEHTPDPIGELRRWHELVVDGGVVVVSLPDKNACQDTLRLEPPFAHLLHDYLLSRGEHAFESKEHALSFNLGWIDAAPQEVGRSPARMAAWLLGCAFEASLDIHWHAFTQSLAEKTVLAAARLGGRYAELLAKADYTTTAQPTLGDIILVYRVHRGDRASSGFRYTIDAELAEARRALDAGLARLSPALGDEPPARLPDAPAVPYPGWLLAEDRPPCIDLAPPFRHEHGHCFVASGLFTTVPGDSEGVLRSTYELVEDGVPLGPAHAPHDRIREVGGGCFSHWEQDLFFSTSDHSDPNRNGRIYQLRPKT